MNDELINSNEIHLQDIVCSVVEANPKTDDFVIYNIVASMVEISSLETADRILSLIKINKTAFNN